jgi:hypothetical protein
MALSYSRFLLNERNAAPHLARMGGFLQACLGLPLGAAAGGKT